VYSRDAHIHTAKILRAIEKITDMLTLPIRLVAHTPFSICMIAITTIAHLSACKYVFEGEQLKVARERIRVAMGALEVYAEVWPRGKKVVGEVKTVARALLNLEPGLETSPQIERSRSSDPLGRNESIDEYASNHFPQLNTSGYFDFPGIGFEMDMGFSSGDDFCADMSFKTGFPFSIDVPIQF
jgi:hypothetical protein